MAWCLSLENEGSGKDLGAQGHSDPGATEVTLETGGQGSGEKAPLVKEGDQEHRGARQSRLSA